MGDRLTDMKVFARVARLESFSAAARELRLSTTATSRRISQLEDALGTRLLRRTTRRLSLTEEGAAYLGRCERVLEEIDDLESTLADRRTSPRGRLRITTGVSFGDTQVAPLVPEFLALHPELTVELEFTDRYVDLVGEGFDVAIRIGQLADSSLMARRLARARLVLCASAGYLDRAGTPHTPSDLHGHSCLVDRNAPRTWILEGGDGPHRFTPEGRLHANSAHVLRDFLVRGMGIGMVPSFVAGPNLATGELVEVLPAYSLPSHAVYAVYAVYPPSRHLSPKVRVWIDFMAEHIGDPPAWDYPGRD